MPLNNDNNFMACKRSSVRLRYSPPDKKGFTNDREAFFNLGTTLLHFLILIYSLHIHVLFITLIHRLMAM
jgi:hypothetical protein